MEEIDLRENLKYSQECVSQDRGELCPSHSGDRLGLQFGISPPNPGPNNNYPERRIPTNLEILEMDVTIWNSGKDVLVAPRIQLTWFSGGDHESRDSGYEQSDDPSKDADKVTIEVGRSRSSITHMCRVARNQIFADFWSDFARKVIGLANNPKFEVYELLKPTPTRVKPKDYLTEAVHHDRVFCVKVPGEDDV